MKLKNKPCFIVPYFGKWPKWFLVYLKTCAHNPEFNWIFYTNCRIPKKKPENALFIKASLREFNRLASKKLGFKIKINHPYKICDLKPAYGLIFEDYIKKPYFWGYTDIDLIYGKISDFITSELLKKYDIITANKKHVVGHFTLLRNTEKTNRLFEKSRDYKKIFQSNELYNFDESSFIWDGFFLKEKTSGKTESISHVIKKEKRIKILAETFNKKIPDEKVKWEKGALRDYLGNKRLYFHFKNLKNRKQFLVKKDSLFHDRFYANKKGIYFREISGTTREIKEAFNYLKIKNQKILNSAYSKIK
jgi:hypothetical protein